MTRLPKPFWPLRDSDIGRIIGLPFIPNDSVMRAFTKASNGMSAPRRYFHARLITILRNLAQASLVPMFQAPEIPIFAGVVRILTGVSKGV